MSQSNVGKFQLTFPLEILFATINKKFNGKFSLGFVALARKKNS